MKSGKKASTWQGIKDLWQLLGPNRKIINQVLLWMCLVQGLMFMMPISFKILFDQLYESEKSHQMHWSTLLLLVLIWIFRMVALHLRRFKQEIVYRDLIAWLRKDWLVKAHTKLLSLSLRYHERKNTGRKVTQIYRGCEQSINAIERIHQGFPRLIFLVINSIIILVMDWKIGIFIFLSLIPSFFLMRLAGKKQISNWEKLEELQGIASGISTESIIHFVTVQSYVQEEAEKNAFEKVCQQRRETETQVHHQLQRYYYAVGMVMTAAVCFSLLAGFYYVIQGQSKAGTLVYLLSTLNETYSYVWEISFEFLQFKQTLIGASRLNEILKETDSIPEAKDPLIPANYAGLLSLKDVSFSYNYAANPILDRITLTIQPGKLVAFVGKSGQGKSTLFKLLNRLEDVSAGAIKLDGVDIRKLALKWYRGRFAVVTQDVAIFEGTIRQNITYGHRNATQEQIIEALKVAHLEEVLEDQKKFPEGIETWVGERGVKLSGGEKQRVGIARAYLHLCNGARILMLDEATSHLDSEAELAVQQAIAEMVDRLRKKTSITILVIAHRLSTVRKADIIYVLEDGQIAEQGTDAELQAQGGIYARLRSIQMCQEEGLLI